MTFMALLIRLKIAEMKCCDLKKKNRRKKNEGKNDEKRKESRNEIEKIDVNQMGITVWSRQQEALTSASRSSIVINFVLNNFDGNLGIVRPVDRVPAGE